MTILDYVLIEACESMSHNGTEFSTAGFQSALSRVTDARPMVTPQAAEAILMSLPNVRRGPTRCTWHYDYMEQNDNA